MLALAWPWDAGATDQNSRLSARLASSLCAGIGGHAGAADLEGLHFAYRPLRSTAAFARSWRPVVLPSGWIVVFHGYFDNASSVAAELATNPKDHARLYALAVERWGDAAEQRIIGEYCALIADPANFRLRLSRSPLRGPPLYYSHDEQLCAAASVPRVLFAAGVEQRLNQVRIADSALFNFTDVEASWFENVAQVPTGSVVELERGRGRVLRRVYDLSQIPDVRVSSDADAIATASTLLDEGVRACLQGFTAPGATLSGGLDSPQVAARALAALPAGQKLPTFTFCPEPGFDGAVPRGMMGDERPFVEAFAAAHPGIEPHFTANEGYEFDHRLNELFHLIGGAPSIMGTMYVFHGLMSEAAKQSCDLLLTADWGNLTFSAKGESGFVEYLLKGQWRQLWLALTKPPMHTGSFARRFAARSLSALLPNGLWRPLHRMVTRKKLLFEHMQPLSSDYRRASGVDERLSRSGWLPDRYQPWNRRQLRQQIFDNENWKFEFYQGLEQMYGVAIRDPTAYRPFVEFCLGLPTKMFMRDGEIRWLARRMARGVMPEAQRLNPLEGWWDADWRLRIGRRRDEFLAELDRLQQDERFGTMLDIPRLRSGLVDLPPQSETDPQKIFGPQFGIQTALVTSRFINYVEGRNA